eukprot:scaffold37804_cov62-Attheya_sp.AAC.6
MAPLVGVAYTIDLVQVQHTFITNLIAGNSTAEAKVEPDAELNDGRSDFRNLRDHYEGIGVHTIDITKAGNDLHTLFYAGEKPPHMWWEEFEKRLTKVFTTYVKKEGRIVHSEDMKLKMLLSKIKADFLKPTKASIETELTAIPMVMTYSRALLLELTAIPMVMTYSRALLLFRNEVSKIHPPHMNNRNTRCNINQADCGRGRGAGRDNGRGGRGYHGGYSGGCGSYQEGYGRGAGRGGRGGRREPRKTRDDSTIITLTNGQKVEYHASFNFPDWQYAKFNPEDKE